MAECRVHPKFESNILNSFEQWQSDDQNLPGERGNFSVNIMTLLSESVSSLHQLHLSSTQWNNPDMISDPHVLQEHAKEVANLCYLIDRCMESMSQLSSVERPEAIHDQILKKVCCAFMEFCLKQASKAVDAIRHDKDVEIWHAPMDAVSIFEYLVARDQSDLSGSAIGKRREVVQVLNPRNPTLAGRKVCLCESCLRREQSWNAITDRDARRTFEVKVQNLEYLRGCFQNLGADKDSEYILFIQFVIQIEIQNLSTIQWEFKAWSQAVSQHQLNANTEPSLLSRLSAQASLIKELGHLVLDARSKLLRRVSRTRKDTAANPRDRDQDSTTKLQVDVILTSCNKLIERSHELALRQSNFNQSRLIEVEAIRSDSVHDTSSASFADATPIPHITIKKEPAQPRSWEVTIPAVEHKFDWELATSTPRPSQFEREDKEEKTDLKKREKIKTRPLRVNSPPREQEGGANVAQPAEKPRRKWVIQRSTDYDTLRILFPLPGEKDKEGTLTWNQFVSAIGAPPLGFEVTHQRNVAYTFTRQAADGLGKVSMTLHKPHYKQHIQRNIVWNYSTIIKKKLDLEAGDVKLADGVE